MLGIVAEESSRSKRVINRAIVDIMYLLGLTRSAG